MAGAGVRDILIEGPWRHRDITANGIRFHVAEGLSQGRNSTLVLLLHGFAQFWWAWRNQIPALTDAGFTVGALDLRGYGASDKTPRGYDQRNVAGDISGVVKSLGFRRAVLVGHDWGGIAAWSTAAYASEQVAALAIIAAPHPLAFPWWQNGRTLGFFQIPLLPERRIMAEDGAYVERLLRSWASPPGRFLSPADARRYRDALMLWPSPNCALEYQRSFARNRVRGEGARYRRALRRGAAVPVLSIHGQNDPLVPVEAMAAAERYLSARHQLVSIPGVGHLPHEEAPGEVNAALVSWLRSLD